MKFEQKVTILVALSEYRSQLLEKMLKAQVWAQYYEKKISRVEDAEKMVRAMEADVEDAERK